MREIDIGAYSAYAIAVKHGYQGTEEEWIQEQEANRVAAQDAADSANESMRGAQAAREGAETAERSAADSARTAEQSKNTAMVGATTATNKATEAEGSAKRAETVADKLEESVSAAADSAQAAKNSEDAAKASESAAKLSEKNAQAIKDSIPDDYTVLSQDVSALKEAISNNLLLFNDYVTGATIELEENTNGIPIKATFRVDGKIVRTDTMTYFPNDTAIKTIVTKRIISNKMMITITEDTETGKTIVSEIEEYNMIDNGSNYENWVIAGNGTTASANGIHLVADGNIEAANYSFGELVGGKIYKFTYEVVSKTINSTMVLSAGNFVSKNVVLDNSIGVHSVNIIYAATSTNRLRIALSKNNEDGTYINLCNFKLVEV